MLLQFSTRDSQDIYIDTIVRMKNYIDRCLKGSYKLLKRLHAKIVEFFTASIRIVEDEDIFEHVTDYVAHYQLMKDRRLLRHADAKAKTKKLERRWYSAHEDDTPPLMPEITIVPRMTASSLTLDLK